MLTPPPNIFKEGLWIKRHSLTKGTRAFNLHTQLKLSGPSPELIMNN